MAPFHPGASPALRKPDASPIRNGDTHANGDLRNSSRTDLSPDDDASRTNDGSDTSAAARPPRKRSQKPAGRGPPLFNDLPDATEEACEGFKVIPDCLYGSKNMGAAATDALDCECREDWRKYLMRHWRPCTCLLAGNTDPGVSQTMASTTPAEMNV